MPKEIFRAMSQSNWSDWTKIAEKTQLVLVKLLNSGKKSTSVPAQNRRTYLHDFALAPEQAGYPPNDKTGCYSDPVSDLSVDSHLVRSI
jgi:Fe-S cluster biosynthesis and repair protein YggX